MKYYLIIVFCFIQTISFGQFHQYASWNSDSLTLDNGKIRRVISISGGNISTNRLKLSSSSDNFTSDNCEEFSLMVNDQLYRGLTNKWEIKAIQAGHDETGGNGATVVLRSTGDPLFELELQYLLYPELPIIRKKITVRNLGGEPIKVEAVDVEHLEISFNHKSVIVLNNYARNRHLGQLFEGNWYDPAVIVHEINSHRGIVIGNEAPGVTKQTTIYKESKQTISAGLTHPDNQFPTRSWIAPGKRWESTNVFLYPYANSDQPYEAINRDVNDFVRKHLGIRLAAIAEKPIFVYNTWTPFYQNINEKLIMELADAAAECGIEEFVIDDGWQKNYGDWGIDKEKFPNGLKPVFDYIKSKGMKPGIWISLAAVQTTSKVYREHPGWLVQKADGKQLNLQHDTDKQYGQTSYSMCMSTDWYNHIKGVILKLIKEHGLEYLKADFAVVSGAYTINKDRSGCHANHPFHKDRPESILENYRRVWQLFDELHAEAPNLFIDCTYETMGALQLIDFDMCKHAEGNWLSNFDEQSPLGAYRVRQMAWWRSPMIPATAMVIGNQTIDDPLSDLSLMSLIGTLPIMLGDPRGLSDAKKEEYNQWGKWIRQMQRKHNFMMFRQELPGFGEPQDGNWDGYQRINSDTKSGGIIGVFRNGARETIRQVFVDFLQPDKQYELKVAPDGEHVKTISGKDLSEIGFTVKVSEKYDGRIFEITSLK